MKLTHITTADGWEYPAREVASLREVSAHELRARRAAEEDEEWQWLLDQEIAVRDEADRYSGSLEAANRRDARMRQRGGPRW